MTKEPLLCTERLRLYNPGQVQHERSGSRECFFGQGSGFVLPRQPLEVVAVEARHSRQAPPYRSAAENARAAVEERRRRGAPPEEERRRKSRDPKSDIC